jgi:hypothetical protein
MGPGSPAEVRGTTRGVIARLRGRVFAAMPIDDALRRRAVGENVVPCLRALQMAAG